jgi:hypothetical protein
VVLPQGEALCQECGITRPAIEYAMVARPPGVSRAVFVYSMVGRGDYFEVGKVMDLPEPASFTAVSLNAANWAASVKPPW